MAQITIKCPDCGGTKLASLSDIKYRCLYCGTTFEVGSSQINTPPPAAPLTIVVQQGGTQQAAPTHGGFPEAIDFPANYRSSFFNSKGGRLYITPDRIIFRPHAFNIGSTKDVVFMIANVVGYERNFATFMSVKFKDNTRARFAAYNKDKIIAEIEKRRKALLNEI